MTDAERDKRTALQWRKSILAYLEFRAGSAWRSLEDRDHPQRLWYLNGIRTINGIGVRSRPDPFIVPPRSLQDIAIVSLAAWSRPALVQELMDCDGSLTDRKLLSRFTRLKLARLIVAARATGRMERSA